MNTNTALFVDTHTRRLPVNTVSVTSVEGKGLVLRHGVEVGHLFEMLRGGVFNPLMPVIVNMQGYEAMSSAGFVRVLPGPQTKYETVVGIQGMPWMKSGGLCQLKTPMKVAVLGARNLAMRVVPTHAFSSIGVFTKNSNPATATAALDGLKIQHMLDADLQALRIIEGQSDYVRAVRLNSYSDGEGPSLEELTFNPEHQSMFQDPAGSTDQQAGVQDALAWEAAETEIYQFE